MIGKEAWAATSIAVGVMCQLWRPAPRERSFPSVADWAAGLRRLRTRFDGASSPLLEPLVEQAKSHLEGLLASMDEPVLLHGDLYHGGESWWNDMRREYPSAPIIAVGVIVLKDRRIVLIRRDKEPARGLWTFPGGAVELGETVREAARREAQEETGLEVQIGEVAAVVDSVIRDEAGAIQYHYVILDFFGRPSGGILQPGTDVSDARWASLADLEALDMTEKAKEIAVRLLTDPASGPWP